MTALQHFFINRMHMLGCAENYFVFSQHRILSMFEPHFHIFYNLTTGIIRLAGKKVRLIRCSSFWVGVLSNMENEEQHFGHILLFYYRKGENAVPAKKKNNCPMCVEKKFFFKNSFLFLTFYRKSVETDEDNIKELTDAGRQITIHNMTGCDRS